MKPLLKGYGDLKGRYIFQGPKPPLNILLDSYLLGGSKLRIHHAGVTADLEPPRIWTPRSISASGFGPPFADLDPPPPQLNIPFS